jgi:hypothetical protein
MQIGTSSLIDHILSKDNSRKICSGSIIDDLSHHFITFLQPDLFQRHKVKQQKLTRRLVTVENKMALKIYTGMKF